MKKHAYLIIANRNFKQLSVLVSLLDDPRNDIYVLIDKTSKEKRVKLITNFSPVYVLPEVPIYWGDYSQVSAEIRLFKTASKKSYEYYHLLSGLDLPLVSQNIIHSFFDKHPKKQFITYSVMESQKNLCCRIKKHAFTKHFRASKSEGKIPFFLLKCYRFVEKRILNLSVSKKNHPIKFGSNWVTLSDDFVQKLVEDRNIQIAKKRFSHGYLVDELFVPYMLEKLGFEDSVYYSEPVHDVSNEFQGNLVYINWWDGSPYVWKQGDLEQLKNAKANGHFFARKFDMNIDSGIIKILCKDIENT